jgi:nucleotide-binding universal stress UspA family protein
MYERVLVPLDGSERAEAILPFVEKMAGPLDAEVVLVWVIEPLPTGELIAAAGVVDPDAWSRQELEAKQYLTDLESRLRAKGLRVQSRLPRGQAADQIVATAVASGSDLIAMTTHGRSGIGRFLFGSVGEAVLRASPVPVLMFRATPNAPKSQ